MGWLYAGSHLPPAPALIGSLPPLSAPGSHTSESWGLKPRSDEAAPFPVRSPAQQMATGARGSSRAEEILKRGDGRCEGKMN